MKPSLEANNVKYSGELFLKEILRMHKQLYNNRRLQFQSCTNEHKISFEKTKILYQNCPKSN